MLDSQRQQDSGEAHSLSCLQGSINPHRLKGGQFGSIKSLKNIQIPCPRTPLLGIYPKGK